MACFTESLRRELNTPSASKLPVGLAASLGIPFAASIGAVVALSWLVPSADSVKVSTVLVFIDVLKMSSVAVLAFHLQALTAEIRAGSFIGAHKSVATKWYRGISVYMYFVAVVLTIHTMLLFTPLICDKGQARCESVQAVTNSMGVTVAITLISSIYLVAFLIGNREFEKNNKGNIAVERFAGAFIYGANIPFIIAFALILITILAFLTCSDLAPESHTFLAGAVAFLIYSSTAANLCVDHYARPFLMADQVAKACPISEYK